MFASARNYSPVHINRFNQDDLDEHLVDVTYELSNRPSSNGINFLWRCLQILPSARMNALEAACHDWLCTPEPHVDLFQKLDRKTIGNWVRQDTIQPIPMDIPNLARSISAPWEDSQAPQSRFFTAPNCEASPVAQATGSGDGDEATGSAAEQANSIAEAVHMVPASVPEEPTPVATTNAKTSLVKKEVEQAGVKQINPPWHSFLKPSFPAHSQVTIKRKKLPKVRIKEYAMLPLPSLDRHLRPPTNPRHRQDVLWELERLNSKFLVDTSPLLSDFKPQIPPAQAPAGPGVFSDAAGSKSSQA